VSAKRFGDKLEMKNRQHREDAAGSLNPCSAEAVTIGE
jgi:hypothetical protein